MTCLRPWLSIPELELPPSLPEPNPHELILTHYFGLFFYGINWVLKDI